MGTVEFGLLMFAIGMAAGGAAVGLIDMDPSAATEDWRSEFGNALYRAGGGAGIALTGLLVLVLAMTGSFLLGVGPSLLLRPYVPEWLPRQAITFPTGLALLYLLIFRTGLPEYFSG